MILDRIDQGSTYPLGSLWHRAFDFLADLPANPEEGRHEIEGDDLFAVFARYETKEAASAILETHRSYVDIQVLLAGEEACCWCPLEGLKPSMPYDAQRDAAFYEHPEGFPARFLLRPGFFAAFFEQDAHMPSLQVLEGHPEGIHKVVLKLRRSKLLLP